MCCTTNAIRLPEFLLGGQRVRYLYLKDEGKVAVPQSCELLSEHQTYSKEMKGIPLFLGSDVLAGISQLTKNHPRIHNRYSKQGLATKLKMPDYRIEEIFNGHQVWFYNIQGLFQTVFEYQRRAVKKDCLLKLRELWLERYEDDLLPTESLITEVMYSHRNPGTKDSDLNLDSDDPNNYDFFLASIDTCVTENSKDAAHCGTKPGDIETVPPVPDTSRSVQPASEVSMSGLVDDQTTLCQTMDSCVDSEKNFHINNSLSQQASYQSQDCAKLKNSVTRGVNIEKQLENLLQEILGKLEKGVNCLPTSDIERLRHLKTILLFALHEIYRDNYSEQTSFPACILNSYTHILKKDLDDSNLTMFENRFGIEPHKNAFLCILSEWLGKEFNNFEKKVGEKVSEFKQNHIGQIGNLPEPQSLVESLFPSCMSCLLENWMGLHRTRYINIDHSNSLDQSDLRDHNYIHTDPEQLQSLSEDIQTNCQMQYPFIQIILEFTNNCLISGVAHVLYSRLRSGLL